MEPRPGYKQTEVGVIPNEWDVVSIGSLINDYRGGASLKPSDFTGTGVKVLPKGGVGRTGWLDVAEDDQKYCSPEYAAANFRNQVDETYTIVVLRDLVPSGPSIGLTVQIREPETYVLAQGVYGFKVNEKAIPGYLVHLSNTMWYRKLANSIMVGSTQVHITNTAYKKALIPLPPVPEQQAMAEVLSDADALIEALEQLIAKKRQVKQGAMQELFTGKRRLPEFEKKHGYKQTPSGVFPEDWDIVPLKLISTMHGRIGWQGLKQSEFTMKADDPFLITGMNFKDGEIGWEEVYHVPWERYEIAKEIQLKTGDVLMTKDGTIGKMLYVDEIPYPGKATLNSHLLVFRPMNNKYIPKFLFYQMNSRAFYNHIEQEKSGTTFFGITQEAVGKYHAFLPSISEQTAIAEILSDMDAEITALEEKLAKARQVKEGMMSKLLTGRVRLV